jgi:hypothetical protein
MRKRRNIPTLPIDFFSDVDNKVNYQKILYSSILDGVEQSIKNNKPSFVMARVSDGKNVKDVSILKESFKTNLETVLDFYEQTEQYELCSKTLNLINQIK